ncbi:DinB family protein [Mycolicibacterium sp. CH28]|uniref:DinB family protein n=1 Tax=Mycolicibacterium sp. CH28 TaxID=2512237 RepID=UPI0010806186|nr:DinB family protein [Mycolicibacterium sp. CH28]TGD84527.1 DinB family protein [Mycolicibacterium sp. CH28]
MNIDEYLYFLDRAFNGMIAALNVLGDDHANQAPPLPGANAPWAVTYHSVQVAEYWIGHLIGGRQSNRDRAAEFTTRGSIAELDRMVTDLRARVRRDLADFDPCSPLANTPPTDYQGPDRELTPVGVLLHVLEELAQHHGQVEVSRDVLLHAAAEASL